jgi:hypothetical protein
MGEKNEVSLNRTWEVFLHLSIFSFRVPVGVPGTFPRYNGESSASVPKFARLAAFQTIGLPIK